MLERPGRIARGRLRPLDGHVAKLSDVSLRVSEVAKHPSQRIVHLVGDAGSQRTERGFTGLAAGREAPGGNAIALIEIDGELPADVLAKVRALPQVQQAKPLRF